MIRQSLIYSRRVDNGFLSVEDIQARAPAVFAEDKATRLTDRYAALNTASLLPIMWSHRQGAEIMKPLATPVIGGMISSLLHILIVTPVIFLWLRGREFRKGTLHASLTDSDHSPH